ncbi:MAG: ATP-dependent RecD-like DNA helicase [Lachnospiraceae bacterium]|nr:ATP-dependent RecD-like DNA helicase [Lachnospiraceae bacterium]
MEEREGYVEHIRFHSPDSGFTVLSISGGKPGEELICVGSFPFLEEGEYIRVRGEMIQHSMYGEQLQVESYEITQPTDADSMLRYLGSGAIKGIGIPTAMKIVTKFGDDTFRIIEREPERLAEIRGVSLRIAQSVHEQFLEKQNVRRVVMYLLQIGISLTQGLKIYKKYGADTEQIVSTNPYRLAEDIQGIGFRIADEIARRIGGLEYSDQRYRACLLHVMRLGTQAGHAYLPKESLKTHTLEYIPEMDDDAFDRTMVALIVEKKLRTVTVFDDDGNPQEHIYLSVYYHTEQAIARMLMDIDEGGRKRINGIERVLETVEDREDLELDDIQRQAVLEATEHGVFVLTGGPGTGKTTTINTIIRVCEQLGLGVVLAAPTGRAAKRMTETTGREAVTIHRLLEVTRPEDVTDSGIPKFRRNEDYPLETDVVIIDEVSMVDMHLMCSLLKAIVPGLTSLILVGDANQLPSVGPGNVLRDIMESGAFSVIMLTKIFRQAEASDIVLNAHRINRGEYPDISSKSKDFFFLQRQNARIIRDLLVQLVKDKLPPYLGVSPVEIQVLTPMRKGELGVEGLNSLLQEALNPSAPDKPQYEAHGVIFRVGDKVMQTRNNYQLEWEVRSEHNTLIDSGEGIFNGDIGVIRDINEFSKQMEIVFDDTRIVYYDFELLEDLEHAYAVTIHKAQGSEYPAVIIPLLRGPRMLMNRNLLYTGVTRAVRCVTIIGDEAAMRSMVDNVEEQKRYTGLCRSIREHMVL